jgi:hypothetical protein
VCLAGAAVLLTAALAVGGETAPVTAWQKKIPNRYFAYYKEGVRVDGDLSDWNLKDGVVEINTDTSQLTPGPVRSRGDSSAVVKFAWDHQYLYLAAVVQDDSLKPLVKKTDMPWACDSLILVTSVFGATRGSPRYHQVKNVETSAEPFFGFSYYTNDTGPRAWTKHSRYLARKSAAGYSIEAAISLADIGYQPVSGDRIKIAFILSDLDEGGKWSQLTLGFPARFVTNSTNFWLDLRFRDATPWAGEIVTAESKLAPGANLQFMGDVDAFAGKPVLRGVVVQDEAGKTVATVPADAALPAGTTTLFSGQVAAGTLPPGTYQVAAAVEEGGKTQTGAASAPFEILRSEEAQQGGVGKLPDRYIVPDPYRNAFPSDRRGYTEMTLTKDDYLAIVKKVYDFEYASIYSKGRQANAGLHGFGYCMAPLALWKATGDAAYLEAVLGLLKGAYDDAKKGNVTPFWIANYKIIKMVLADPGVKEEDKVWLRDFYPAIIDAVWKSSKPTEWGAFNRALLWGGFCDQAAQVMPNHPDVEKWKQYAELEWNSWFPYRDHDENSSDYNAASMMDYLDWANFRNPEYLKDPGFAKWVERYMYQVTPSGGMPGYGDAAPWNASCYMWMPVYERMATITRDGRFKWAAHRLLEYANRQMDDLFSYHAVYDGAATSCAWAYLYADDTVAEVAPEEKSRILERHQITQCDEAFKKEMFDKYGITGLFYRLGETMQPDKLILRAGNDPFAPCGMIELCGNAGHHMSTVPNFNNLMDMRTVLLTDLGYYEKGPEYHNVVLIEDLTGIAPEVPDEVVTVPVFTTGGRVTYARVRVENYKSWPVTNEREVLFTNAGLVICKDLVTFQEPFVCRVRQQWQTRNISPKSGPNWTNVNINYLLMTGLGLGRGVQRWNNPNWDLLIYYTPQPGRDYEVFDRSLENQWQAVPLRISQRYRGLPEKGKPIHFTTLLWPHKPLLEVEQYADRVTVLKDTPEVTGFRVLVDDTHAMYLVINDRGAKLEAGDLSTDASVLVLEANVDPTGEKPSYLYATDATTVALKGKAIFSSQEKANVDKAL